MPALPTATDTALFAALRTGESAALDELFRRHYVELCRVAIRLVTDGAAAEDIVQEMFTSLWTKRDKLPEETPAVSAYLRRSVRNRSLNFLRDRKRIPVDNGDIPENSTDTQYQPAAALEQEELQVRINRAIDRLPERCRLVFVMSKVEDMAHREIAEELGISVKTVENQMTRAYKFLREWLAPAILLIFAYFG
ncbi:RNA polymerase sigma-70 factor (ECF subfamily) [Lewinella aquimaris]|uniref:RNA polymerase sigma-70 factor (ECF subfamily) n=1 Tax=Neolewinella aquimaris TaxID=1835722 RepID=A0A840DY40_9BACT|nr:RNA polymerase sigma-70 factor [Neolewinella aquimaris]MBB4078144.1 RNA polymerase sigma-70 factor (ECF subfamily) [Neolewinella aquimaris]